jgi:succinyl-CoA synthetase alpha subunit
MMVVLGELGGKDEYSLVEALKQGKVQKPVVAWVSGTCARLFKSEVQFGHAVSIRRLLELHSALGFCQKEQYIYYPEIFLGT